MFVCLLYVGERGAGLFPGSTALNPAAVSPGCRGTLSTAGAGRFRLGAAARHPAGHAAVGVAGDEHLIQLLLDLGQLV